MANGILGKPDDSNYSFDDGDGLAPDHIWLFTEGSGTTLGDDHPTDTQDMTLSNSAAWTTASGTQILGLSGNSYTGVVADDCGVTGFPFTMSVLCRYSTQHAGAPFMIGLSSSTDRWGFRTSSSNGRMQVVARNGTENINNFNTTDYSDNTWRWYTIVFTSATVRDTYINTTAGNTASTSVAFGSTLDTTRIGYRPQGGWDFEGDIAAAMLWNSTGLTSGNVSSIFGNSPNDLPFLNYDPGGASPGVTAHVWVNDIAGKGSPISAVEQTILVDSGTQGITLGALDLDAFADGTLYIGLEDTDLTVSNWLSFNKISGVIVPPDPGGDPTSAVSKRIYSNEQMYR